MITIQKQICRAGAQITFATVCLGVGVALCASAARAQALSPAALRVDEMTTPLGIDDAQPRFSWQLRDSRQGARQTAYRLLVATQPDLLAVGHADVWDSGRVAGGQSVEVPYAGAALVPTTRYYWKVLVWDQAGKPEPESPVSWWETGLMKQEWRAQWIGYETPEEAAVRQAPAAWIAFPDQFAKPVTQAAPAGKPVEQRIAYRLAVTLAKPVLRATLYATAQDTVSAWINGAQVLTASPYPPWRQLPWKKFVSADATETLATGANTIAIEQVHYAQPGENATSLPMIATLFVEYKDGTTEVFASGTSWKSSLEAAPGWQQKSFDDAGWKNAVVYKQAQGMRDEPMGHPWIPDSVKALHHSFDVAKGVKSARLYATALGTYEMFLNGASIGDQVLAPGWTDYRQRVVYQAYDVTDLIAQGENAIGALLAPGWFETPLEWFQQPNNYGLTPPALRAQLRIEHTDGSVEWIKTDTDWQANTSYILHSELYDGETQDDRAILQTLGTFVTSVIAESWPHAIPIDPRPVEIVAQSFPPIRVERELQAVSVTEPRAGVYVYDFGQNLSGVESLKLKGPEGTDLRLRFAEVLNADGTVYTENLRTAKATDHFVLGGARVTEFSPQFTFHGFRYAELTGLPTAPGKDAITAEVFHTDTPITAKLETGSALINQLWSNIQWGQRSNFVGIPTDCPQRDERLGWMGDAQVFWRAASYNMDLAAFSRKFAADMRGTQAGVPGDGSSSTGWNVGTPYYGIYSPGTVSPNAGHAPGWSDAGVIIPWTSWLQTGDKSIIEENWAAMEKYLDAIAAANPDGLWRHETGIPFGDWLSPEGKTDIVLIATTYWAYDATLMREMAHATGRAQAEEKYRQLSEKIRAAFEKQFVREDGFVAGADNSASPFGAINNPNAKSKGGDTQTGYVLALHMNLLPQELRAAAAKKLVDKIHANHDLLATGFLGTPYLLEELTKAGYPELAYTLLLNTEYPSWGYMVKHGATTMWERWNGDQMMTDPGMNSFNHYAYGAVADWMYRYAAGIDATPLDAGFHTILLHPVFDRRLGNLDLRYQSPYGEIHSSWKVDGDKARWTVTIPPNASGWLSLTETEAATYTLNGKPLGKLEGKTGYELASGTYLFEVTGVK